MTTVKKAKAKAAPPAQKPWAERRAEAKDVRPDVQAAYQTGTAPVLALQGPALGPYRPPREP